MLACAATLAFVAVLILSVAPWRGPGPAAPVPIPKPLPPVPGTGPATYFVSPGGNDDNAGAKSGPWRSIARVNSVALRPGDTVLFEGGQTFSDATLNPPSSGEGDAPITFGSYGRGRATIANSDGAVEFAGKDYLVFENLRMTTEGSSHGILAGSPSAASVGITIRNSVFENTASFGVNIPAPGDTDWQVQGNTFTHIGDSAVISLGARTVVSGNRISDIGWSGLSYATHGVYAKGPDQVISANDISGVPNGQAVSIRFHGIRVFDNAIHDTPYAVGFFDNDTASPPQGTSYVYKNRVWNLTGWFFYYAGELDPSGNAPSVSFVVAGNTVSHVDASESVNVSESRDADVTFANNVVTGSYGSAFRAVADRTSEHHNLWHGASSNVPNGVGDLQREPGLSSAPEFVPLTGSIVVDGGSASGVGLAYAPTCDGSVLSYCGAAPDIGATESAPATAG